MIDPFGELQGPRVRVPHLDGRHDIGPAQDVRRRAERDRLLGTDEQPEVLVRVVRQRVGRKHVVEAVDAGAHGGSVCVDVPYVGVHADARAVRGVGDLGQHGEIPEPVDLNLVDLHRNQSLRRGARLRRRRHRELAGRPCSTAVALVHDRTRKVETRSDGLARLDRGAQRLLLGQGSTGVAKGRDAREQVDPRKAGHDFRQAVLVPLREHRRDCLPDVLKVAVALPESRQHGHAVGFDDSRPRGHRKLPHWPMATIVLPLTRMTAFSRGNPP